MDSWDGIGSLFIASIEFVLFINLLVFAEKNRFNNIAILMVLILTAYQILEFLMCQMSFDYSFLPYLAFIVISFLPPLMLILLAELFDYKSKIINLVFLPAVIFIIYYSFVIDKFAVTSCTVLYASYNYPLGDLFGFIYYTPIIISTIVLSRAVVTESEKQRLFSIKVLLFGNIFILVPVVVGFVILFFGNWLIISKIESIMCKFAFVYAVCLAIMCLYNSKKK